MPIFAYFAVVAWVLIALLFVADPMLEKDTRAVVTSERVGLPKPWQPDSRYPNAIRNLNMRNLATAPAPAPDMASNLVRASMPKAQQSAPEDDLAKVEPAARAARAEAPSAKKPQNNTWSHLPGGREFGLSGH